jgi:hypothetical protein
VVRYSMHSEHGGGGGTVGRNDPNNVCTCE